MQSIMIALACVVPRFRIRLVDEKSVFPDARLTLRPRGGLPAYVAQRE